MGKEFNWDEFLELLKEQHDWPTVYVFKFVVPTEKGAIENLLALFDLKAEYSTRESRNGKYTAVTIKQKLDKAEDVVEIYQQAKNIEGVISL